MSPPPSTAGIEDLLTHADWLRRLATHLVRDRDAEDLIQETWVAALRAPPTLDRPTQPWLATVLRNLARHAWRAQRVQDRARPSLELATAPEATPHELLERAQIQKALAEAVVELEEPYRTAVLLRYYEGRSAADIARELGLPAGTVRWRLSEGVERLRRRLDDRHGGDRKVWKALLAPLGLAPSSPPGAQAPLMSKGEWLMALGTKAKVGIGAAVLIALALGLAGRHWMAGEQNVPRPGVAAVRSPRSGLPALMPAGTVSDQSGTIEGVVRDPGGRPLAGAVVALAGGPAGARVAGASRPAATVLTSRQGDFRLPGVAAGEYRVSATAVGFAPALSAPFVLGTQEGRRLDLTVSAGGHTLEGRVLDDGGGAVPGARVTAWAGSGGSMRARGPATIYQVVADDEGRYQISLAEREYTLRGEASGYAPTETTIPVTRDLRRDLRLHPAARISGRVLDRDSREPVPDAQVTVSSASRMERSGWREVRTDVQGRFQIDDAVSGTYQVLARLGGAQGVGPEIAVVSTQVVEGVEVLLDMRQGAAGVEGRVVDPAGAGIAGARIVAGESTVSGPDGTFRLAGLAPGPVRLKVTGPTPELGEAEELVTVGADGTRDVRIVVSPSPILGGTVRDAGGVPVGGAQVRAEPQGRDGRAILVETAVDGSFRLTGLPAGRTSLLAWHPTLGLARQDVGPLTSNQRVDLRLGPGGSIAGVVRFDDGQPAAAVSVGFTGQERGSLYTSVATGDDGAFRASGLPPGKYTVRARRKAGPWNIATAKERPELRLITIEEGEQRQGVELELERGGQRIAGSVVLPDGKPAAGATIVANIEERGQSWRPTGISIEHSAVAREDGTFLLDDIEAGSFTLWASRPGMPEVSVANVAAGRRDVRLSLRPSGSLAGVVVDGQGRPVPRFSLNVLPAAALTAEDRSKRDSAGLSQRSVNDPGGAFEWGGLSAGTWEVQARTGDGAGGKQIVALAAGEQKQAVRVVVAAGATIAGTVVALESGAPLAQARLYARIAGRHVEAATDARGAFELTGMLPGEEVNIRATAGEDLVPEDKIVRVPAGVVRIDAGSFRLMKRDPARPMRQDGTIRMAVENRDDRVAVGIVRPGSPAERSGIRPGDAILSIDGRDARPLGAGAIYYLLDRKPGESVSLVVQTPGAPPRTVSATAEAMARPAATAANTR